MHSSENDTNSDLPDYNSFYCKNTRLLMRCEQAGEILCCNRIALCLLHAEEEPENIHIQFDIQVIVAVNVNGNIISAFNSRELDAFRKSPLLQSSRGSYTSPALSCDSYPFVDLPPRNDCRSNHSWATSFRMFIANSHPCDRIKKMKL